MGNQEFTTESYITPVVEYNINDAQIYFGEDKLFTIYKIDGYGLYHYKSSLSEVDIVVATDHLLTIILLETITYSITKEIGLDLSDLSSIISEIPEVFVENVYELGVLETNFMYHEIQFNSEVVITKVVLNEILFENLQLKYLSSDCECLGDEECYMGNDKHITLNWEVTVDSLSAKFMKDYKLELIANNNIGRVIYRFDKIDILNSFIKMPIKHKSLTL